MACEVLNIFDSDSDDFMNGILLLQNLPYYNELNCLQMAVEADCKEFIATPAVQNLITHIWNGQVSYKSNFKFSFKVNESFFYFLFMIYSNFISLVYSKHFIIRIIISIFNV